MVWTSPKPEINLGWLLIRGSVVSPKQTKIMQLSPFHSQNMSWRDNKSLYLLACEQALREKEGELATTSLEFEYLHWKSWCETLIGGDDIGYDVITLGMCFSVFVYFCAYFRFALISGNVTAQSTESHRWNSNSRDVVASSPSFSSPVASVPWIAC